MPLTLAALLTVSAAFPAALPTCSWNRPGHNPFMGDVVAAVDRYPDIPAPVRARLKERMASRSYDEIVSIRRDAIVGKARYSPEIRNMHFGTGQVCGTVNRMQWPTDAQERGLVYCEAGHCILVPTVCRNVSRITRENPAVAGIGAAAPAPAPASADGGGGGGGGGGTGPGGSIGSAGAPEGAAGGQEAAAPTSFVAGLSGAESAGAGGIGAGGVTPAGAGGAGGAGGSGGSWLAAASGAPLAAGPASDPTAVTPSGVAGGSEGGGVPPYVSSSGLPGPGRGMTTGSGLPNGGMPGGNVPDTGFTPSAPPIPAVPEPGTWALMLGGLAVLIRRGLRSA